jgi:PAS domain S-box-containing protein
MLFKSFNILERLRLSHKGILLVCVPLLFELIFISVLMFMEFEVERTAAREARAKDALLHISQTQLKFEQIAQYTIVYFLTKNDIWRQRVENRVFSELPAEMSALRASVSHEPKQLAIADELTAELQQFTQLLTRFQKSIKSEGNTVISLHSSEWQREFLLETGKIGGLVKDMQIEAEKSRQSEPKNPLYSRANIMKILVIGVFFNVVITILLALYFSRGIARRAGIIVDNANRMISGLDLNAQQGGYDEISQLDRVFHTTTIALQEAARKERAIFDNAVDVICKIDQSGMLADVNQAAEAVWSYPPRQLIGKRFIDLIDRSSQEFVYNKLSQIKASEQPDTFEAKVNTRDGHQVDMLWSVHWSGIEESYFCVAHDVSERKKVEQMKQDFVNMVSHDLRTPMLSFQMFLDLLTSGKAGELQPRTLNMAQDLSGAMRTLTSLINDLLDIEKMESGRFALRIAQVSAEDVLDEAEDAVRTVADAQNINITHSGSENVTLNVDHDRICQVVTNLLSNAIKFAPARSAIKVSCALKGDWAEFRVRDEGPGVAPELKEVIFERFRQGNGSARGGQAGSGLGLAICKQIVSLHGGTIGCDSDGRTGSEFWFTVPATQRES